MTKRWMLILAAATVLVGGGLAIAALVGGDDEPADPYAALQEQLTTTPDTGQLLDTFEDAFNDPVPNPCDPNEVGIFIDSTGSVYDHGDEAVLIVQESQTSTESGFEGTGFFWLIDGPDGAEPGGYFESGTNAETGERYVRYGEGVFPDQATTDCIEG